MNRVFVREFILYTISAMCFFSLDTSVGNAHEIFKQYTSAVNY